jgi:CheY-like chemotaxis protein
MSSFGDIARTLYAKRQRDTERGAPPTRESVMIVDDNLEVIEALRQILQQRYDVVACSSYAEVDQGYTDHIKVVLLDVKMAPRDGLEVFSLLRQKNPRVRVLFNTAYAGDSAAAAQVRALDADGYLTKGEYSTAELEAAIEQAMGRYPPPEAPG